MVLRGRRIGKAKLARVWVESDKSGSLALLAFMQVWNLRIQTNLLLRTGRKTSIWDAQHLYFSVEQRGVLLVVALGQLLSYHSFLYSPGLWVILAMHLAL